MAVLLLGVLARGAQDTPPADPPSAQQETPPPVPPEEAPPAPQPSPTPAEPVAVPATRVSPPYDARYHALEEIEALVDGWVHADRPADGLRVERVHLPLTPQGLATPALQWGAAGEVPLAERPTIFLLGGLDGSSLSGSEAVLAVTAALVGERAPQVPAGLAFVAVPWASPEGLSRTLQGRACDGRDLSPLDDDGDLLSDEDGPDDLDGDEVLLDMLIEDPAGPWVRAADPRFLALARAGDAPRYRLVREGKDDDGDGRFNEDPLGGVILDRSFPIGWGPRNSDGSVGWGGSLPLEQALARAIADLMLARKTVCVLAFQGNHGVLCAPGARAVNPWPAGADQRAFDSVLAAFTRATGRSQAGLTTLYQAHGEERGGAVLDWSYLVPGSLAFEVGVWGPAVEPGAVSGTVNLTDAHFGGHPPESPAPPTLNGAPLASAADQAWARWLDNTRGGIGFVDWHPVELGNGRQALVGGWEPLARANPPAAGLALALRGLPSFVADVANSSPRLEMRLPEVRRDGEICTIRARVENGGRMPTGISSTERARLGTALSEEQYGIRVEIVLPPDARLLAGQPAQWIGHLCGGGSSAELSWVVLAAPSSAFTLRVTSPWTLPVVQEVKP